MSSVYTGVYGTYWPSKGNDGDKSNCNALSFSNSVANTQLELNPWHAVDLGTALHVAGVMFTNRADMNGKLLSHH